MKKMLFLLLAALPAEDLIAQEDFEGKIVYSEKKFTKNDNSSRGFTLWISGKKMKIQSPAEGQGNGGFLLADFEKDSVYVRANQQEKIIALPVDYFDVAFAYMGKPVFAGDSIQLYGSACYKYILPQAPTHAGLAHDSGNQVGWFSKNYRFAPGAKLRLLQLFSDDGHILMKMEVFKRKGVYESLIMAAEMTAGKPDDKEFFIDERDIDRSINGPMDMPRPAEPSKIKMPNDDDVFQGRGAIAPVMKKKHPVRKRRR